MNMLALKSGPYFSVILLTVVSLSCMDKSQQTRTEIPPVQDQAAASPSLRLKEIWTAQASKLNNKSKSFPAEQLDLLLTLLDKAPEDLVIKEMEQLRAKPAAESELSEYERVLLEAFVVRWVRQNNTQMLIYLISAKCPRFVGSTSLELYLTMFYSPDPLLILIESYRKSVNEDARKTLLQTLNHVCSLSRETFSDDNDYVSAIEDWYLKNKDHIKPDPYYVPNSILSSNRILFEEGTDIQNLKNHE